MRTPLAVPLSAAAAAAAVVGYGAGYEVRSFRLRTAVVPVLPEGAAPVRVLHLSDMHLTPLQRRKQDWVRALDRLDPDLVINTGDTLAHADALGELKYALGPLLERPGAFVLGSNDRYAPVPKNPGRYLRADTGIRTLGPELPWQSARDAMAEHGWADLTNSQARLRVGELQVAVAGVDDPHIGLDRYDAIAGPLDPTADLHLGVTHSPEPRVLDRFVSDGYPLVFAGHTHGGQLRIPFYGALVTNCGLDRGRARGLSRYKSSWLHVSAGLGTSPYAPVRIACPPEATLLTLLPVR